MGQQQHHHEVDHLHLVRPPRLAVAEREFNLCAREEKVCPGGVKPKTPCADGSQPKCPSGSAPLGSPTAPGPPRTGTTHGANRQLGIMALYNHPKRPTRCLKFPSCMLKQILADNT